MIRSRLGPCFVVAALGLAGVTCAGDARQDPVAERRSLVRQLDRGDAEAVERALGGRAADGVTGFLLAEAAATRGRLGRADSLFARVAGAESPVRALASARQAELRLARGDRAGALALAERVADRLEAATANTADDWLALGIVYQILGADRPAQFKDALVAYDRAVAADSALVEGHLRLGGLFLDKYNAPDARAAFGEALRRDPGNARAELGLALVAQFEGNPETAALLARAARSGPGLGRIHAALGRLDLDAEAFDSAEARAARAIGLDSADLGGWAVRAAVELVRGDSAGFRATEAAVRARHRAPAAFYADLAEALGRQRQYAAAAAMARVGVAADADDPAALTALGTNELRLGAIDSGRARLERAFARDPYHVWNKNTLDLLDELAKYRTVTHGRFVFVAAPEEVDLLALYLGPLLERAFDSLAARYRYQPPTPIRLEIFRRHADFSVRTVGLAGLGALGVSFGSVLAIDAPSARGVGDFNWASTAWHELAHAFTLGVTDHKVPRWLSEGLSVLEERRARSGWGAGATTPFVAALAGGQLRPLSRINDGFVRPTRPHDVGFAYYQASLLCEFLETTYGFDGVLRLLGAYRQGLGTDEAIQTAFGAPVSAVGARFDGWIRARFATPLKSVGVLRDSTVAPGELVTLLASGKRMAEAGRLDDAVTALEKADRMFPDMADDDSPAWALAQLYRRRGDVPKALEYLGRVTRYNESQYEANRLEAELRTATGDHRGALAALERAIYIHPYDPAVHVAAAEAARLAGQPAIAVRERRAVLALAPADRAGAHYELAVALRDAGDRDGARREVLKALEEAPAFERAQALLLELRRGGS
ncbi:MAG: tetratricopeptide repeat protein [Gemmatimonadales bacterium]|nr:tetratricopeptide repeat protein [Gemmatimonadales bacterium]